MQLHQQNPGQGYDVRAFHGSERSRARSLIDLIAEAQLDLRSSNQPALQPLLAQEREILAAIRSAEQQLIQRLHLGNSPNEGGANPHPPRICHRDPPIESTIGQRGGPNPATKPGS